MGRHRSENGIRQMRYLALANAFACFGLFFSGITALLLNVALPYGVLLLMTIFAPLLGMGLILGIFLDCHRGP